ncbi:SH2 domain-containing protein [Marinigracilibium pacificum]|uniref:YD repeat-containing protein n=1 Tax=Marinigracilibium pacificum TaxID=2729599 RepID=A0A848IVM4_9BACT|nr:hypothetical protein [Marinigracilibium pacificum]NMM48533.1 hypothetical protein [Marinigracilibium pacificum]
MNRQITFFIIYLIVALNTFGQISPLTYNNDVIPPAPESSNLGRYGESAVNMHTGTPEISIPLYTVKSGNIKFPIELKYNANGIKVSDIGSRVGMGWTLNASGVITRSVRGGRWDEYYYRYACPNGDYDKGDCEVTGYLTQQNSFCDRYGDSDNIPDAFYYNFPGYTGSFTIIRDHDFLLTPYYNFKIKYTYGNGFYDFGFENNDVIGKFDITDDSGLIYTFDQLEEIIATSGNDVQFDEAQYDLYGRNNNIKTYSSSFFMSQINDPISRKKVSFKYLTLSNAIRYTSMHYTYYRGNDDTPGTLKTCFTGQSGEKNPAKGVTYVQHSKLIQEIVYDNGKVKFHYGQNRLDLDGDKELSRIEIFDPNSIPIKSFEFIYEYTNATNSSDFTSKRMYLMELKEYDSKGNFIKSHKFKYHDKEILPDRESSKAQDLFGYYNGKISNHTMKPTIYYYPDEQEEILTVFKKNNYLGTEYKVLGSNRSTSFNFIKAGTIKEITYPTGGSTQFEFEPHTFINNDRLITGGGIRIKRIITNDDNNGQRIIDYSYEDPKTGLTSGRVNRLPNFGMLCRPYDGSTSILDYLREDLNINISSQSKLGLTSGSYVEYSNIQVKEYGKGTIQYNYFSMEEFPDKSNGNIYNQKFTNFTDAEIDLFERTGYPHLPFTINSHIRSKLKSIDYYDEDGTLVKKDTFEYNINNVKNKVINNCVQWDRYDPNQIIENSYSFKSDVILPESEIQILWDKNINKSTISRKLNYYDNVYYQLKESQIIQNENEKIIQYYKYPYDYQNSSHQEIFNSLVLDNRINNVIETQKWKSNSKETLLIDHKIRLFEKFADNILPKKYLEREISESLKFESFNEIIDPFDPHQTKDFITKDEIIKYDYYSNPITIYNYTGNLTNYYWGFYGNFPTAKLIYSEININDGLEFSISKLNYFKELNESNYKDLNFVNEEIRSKLSNNQFIETYTYHPEYGITSITDTNGKTTFYQYSKEGKLETIRDNNWNILKYFRYKIKENANP